MDALVDAGFLNNGLMPGIKDAQPSIDVLISLMDELACGLMITTYAGLVIHANRVARSELARTGLLQPAGELCLASAPEHARAMQDAFAQAATGVRSLVRLSSDSAGLTLVVIPLNTQPRLPARVALVFSRTAVHEPVMLGFFARSHGLTATEELVLGILCQGYSAPDVAAQMKLGVSTVRSHVRSMCAKTRSCGIRELVSKVAVLPPITSPSFSPSGRDQMH